MNEKEKLEFKIYFKVSIHIYLYKWIWQTMVYVEHINRLNYSIRKQDVDFNPDMLISDCLPDFELNTSSNEPLKLSSLKSATCMLFLHVPLG